MKYYVYKHIRLDKNEPFYIGIGTTRFDRIIKFERAHTHFSRNIFWQRVVNKTDYIIEIVYEANVYFDVKKKEIELIKLYGRRDLGLGTLCNLTDGGEGSHGWIPSKESILKRIDKTGIKVINKITGEIYSTIAIAAKQFNYSKTTLLKHLRDDVESCPVVYFDKDKKIEAEIKRKEREAVSSYRGFKNIKNKSSSFIGVHFDFAKKKWTAQIRLEDGKKYLGRFFSEKEAANAYAQALIDNNIKVKTNYASQTL